MKRHSRKPNYEIHIQALNTITYVRLSLVCDGHVHLALLQLTTVQI